MKLKKRSPDWWLLCVMLLLVAVGIIMVFSASQYAAQHERGDSFYYLKKQLQAVAIGLLGFFLAYKIDFRVYRRLAWPAYLAVVVILLMVLFSTAGDEVKGATRWITIAGLRFQPSEPCKLAMAMLLAKILTDKQKNIKSFARSFLPVFALMGLSCALVFLQNDLSTTVVIAGMSFIMMFCSGIRPLYLTGTLAAGLAAGVSAIIMEPYRFKRITAFLDPWSDPLGSGFQTIQSLLAIGSGGLTGVGLGNASSKWFYLPEMHTDFIFSVLAEELGLLGGLLVIILFVLLIWRGLLIAVKMPDVFGSFLALGITTMIGLQAFINLGVATGLLPVTGVTLPFISYGGTSLIISMTAVGVLWNLSRFAEIKR
ncbi:MAG: putative lipid II flippase FtsW [Clostridiales bacterium]|nr:putative lipid II flippase FtsW [Clostridiales bacterium]